MGIFNFGKNKTPDQAPEKLDLSYQTGNNYQSANFYDAKYDYTTPYLERYNGNGHIYFGLDNLYPDLLNNLYNSSGLHSAIIEFKRNLISGAGYTIEGEESLANMKKVELKQFINLIDGENTLDHSLNELTLDYLIHGTVYFKVFWNSNKSRILKLKRIEPSKIRVGVNPKDVSEITKYYFNFDWRENGRYPTTSFPAYAPLEKNSERVEIYRFINPNPTVNWNTLPQYASGANWMALDGEISNYHKSNIENSINPSMALKFYKKPANEEEKRLILNGVKKNFQGSSNTGKAMVFFSDSKDTAPDIEPIAVSNIDKQFSITSDQIQRNICYSHRINPMIMGLKTPGSLGNGAELETSYEIFNQSCIQPAQKDIERIINGFLKMNGLGVEFKLNDANLFGTDIEIDENIAEAVGEVSDDAKTKDAQAALKGSVGGVTGIITLLQTVSAGTMDKESAISVLVELYGLDPAVARAMVTGEAAPTNNNFKETPKA